MIIEKDTLPRFKATSDFISYLEKEPYLFKLPVPTRNKARASSVAAAT